MRCLQCAKRLIAALYQENEQLQFELTELQGEAEMLRNDLKYSKQAEISLSRSELQKEKDWQYEAQHYQSQASHLEKALANADQRVKTLTSKLGVSDFRCKHLILTEYR